MKAKLDEIYLNNESHGYKLYHLRTNHGSESTKKKLHFEGELMIVYFIDGTGNLKVEGKHYDICPGDIIIINPDEFYQLNVDDGIFHERIILHPSETVLKNIPGNHSSVFMSFYKRKKGEYNIIPAEHVKKFGIDKDLKQLLKLVLDNTETNSVLAICKVIELVIKLSQIILPLQTDRRDRLHENPLIADIIQYIKVHLKENITIDSIADNFNIGKSYLSHVFKEQVGISLWNYVISRRICMFNYLVKDSNSIEETAYKVGFQNYSNFFRLYKKYTGMTPTEFKKKSK